MALFKNKKIVTGEDLLQVAQQCSTRSEQKLAQTINSLRDGSASHACLSMLNELYCIVYGSKTKQEPYQIIIELNNSVGLLKKAYLYYLFVHFVICELRETHKKSLSLEALNNVEENVSVLSFIQRYSPAKGLSDEKQQLLNKYIFKLQDDQWGMYSVSIEKMLQTEVDIF